MSISIETPVETLVEARNALAVIAIDPNIRAHLESNDPQALSQVMDAIRSVNKVLGTVATAACITKDRRHLYSEGRCAVCSGSALPLGS